MSAGTGVTGPTPPPLPLSSLPLPLPPPLTPLPRAIAPPSALRATSTIFVPRSIPPPPAPHEPRATSQGQGVKLSTSNNDPQSQQIPTPKPKQAAANQKQPKQPRQQQLPAPPQQQQQQPPKKKQPATKQPKKPHLQWWASTTACDPITLEPLCDLAYPPFELTTTSSDGKYNSNSKHGGVGVGVGDDVNNDSDAPAHVLATARVGTGAAAAAAVAVSHLFDGPVLAEYVTSSKQFENPLNRVPMDALDCRRLDAHLLRYKLRRFNVSRAFASAAKERRQAAEAVAARANETAEEAMRRREDLQSELAQSLFTSLRARAGRERAQREHNDDEGGRSRGSLGDHMEHLFGPSQFDRSGGGRSDGGGGGSSRGVGGDGGRRVEGRRDGAVMEEGAFALVDDDEGMRGVTLGRTGRRANGEGDGGGRRGSGAGEEEWTGWRTGWEDETSEPVEEFPALGSGGGGDGPSWGGRGGGGSSGGGGGVSSTEAAFPALPGSGGGFLWTTVAGTASTYVPVAATRHAIRRQAVPKAPATALAAAVLLSDLPSGPSGRGEAEDGNAEEDPAAARRRQLAAAFGVSRPEQRPSMFAASAADAFTREVMATARAHPDEVVAMERTIETMCGEPGSGCRRRISLEPMPKRLRAVVRGDTKPYTKYPRPSILHPVS